MKQGMRKQFAKGVTFCLVAILLFGACGEKDMEQSMNVMVSSDVQTSESAEIATKREDGENTTLTETESPKKVNEKLLDRAKVDPASIIYADSYSFEKLTFDGVELVFAGFYSY